METNGDSSVATNGYLVTNGCSETNGSLETSMNDGMNDGMNSVNGLNDGMNDGTNNVNGMNDGMNNVDGMNGDAIPIGSPVAALLPMFPLYKVGDKVEYQSTTHKQWMAATVMQVNNGGES